LLPNNIKSLPIGKQSRKITAVLPIEKVFLHKHGKHNNSAMRRGLINGLEYKVDRRSLSLFKSNKDCVSCGITISFGAITLNKEGQNILNFWGITKKGKYILFTKDHIIPKSKGGTKELSNLQTMCYECNQRKADTYKPLSLQKRPVETIITSIVEKPKLRPKTFTLFNKISLTYIKEAKEDKKVRKVIITLTH